MRRFLLAVGFVVSLAHGVHAQNVQLMPVLRQQYLSINGAILPNEVLYVYNAGTSTQAATYQDSAGTVLNQNPIPADATGHLPPVWLLNQQYKFVWCLQNDGPSACASGDILASQDNVPGFGGGSSGSSSSPFISASPNPATTGILRLGSGDTTCWRNAANNANLCWSKSTNDLLSWSQGSMSFPEVATPAGLGAGTDMFWADNTAHRLKMSNNGGAADVLAGAATTDTFTNKTFDTGGAGNVFKIAGTQITAVTGSGAVALATSPALTSPALTTPTIGGTTITNVPAMVWSGMIPTQSINASNTTSFSQWTTLFPITIKSFFINGIVGLNGSCSVNPAYSIEDNGSVISTLTYSASSAISNTNINYNMAAGRSLTINQTTGGTGCATGLNANFNVTFQMQ